MFKANCLSCPSWFGKKPQRAACPVKPSKHYSGSSKNEFTRRNPCAWFSKTLQNKKEMNDGERTSNEEKSNGKPEDG
jgi:hypothetical protein